jgi:hypothetical protein
MKSFTAALRIIPRRRRHVPAASVIDEEAYDDKGIGYARKGCIHLRQWGRSGSRLFDTDASRPFVADPNMVGGFEMEL